MKFIIPFIFLFCAGNAVYAQITADSIHLCNTEISLITYAKEPVSANTHFISVHEDEATGISATKQVVDDNGGAFTYIHHQLKRNISFTCGTVAYTFDPNRIFSDSGRKRTLEKLSQWNVYADSVVKKFAENFTEHIKDAEHIIALHNNTNENYSINSYLKGGSEFGNAAKIYINKKEDADEFIFTTDENIFRACKKLKLNVALQDNTHCFDDGSLSVYFGRKNISYTNIEAEHGHQQKQTEMIQALMKIIKDDLKE